MADSFDDLIACEDVLLFVNAAITATGQREFRDTAAVQSTSLEFLHEYMRVNYRELYAASLALGVNDHNAALIIAGLLGTARDCPPERRAVEGALIARRLTDMAPQRAYRLFARLARDRVNNRRTRAIVRDWIAARPDPFLDAVKYRNNLRVAARHAHLDLDDPRVEHSGERGRFLFPGRRHTAYRAALLDTWREAHHSASAIVDLPLSVAEGFAARHGISRARLLDKTRMTDLERLRLKDSAASHNVDTNGLERAPLTRIASYVLSLSTSARDKRRHELESALRHAARRAVGTGKIHDGLVVAVLDDSYSSIGSPHKPNRPLAVALATHHLLGEACGASYRGLWVSGAEDALTVRPTGATSLGARIVDALEMWPDLLVIVSDGGDNAPEGLAREVLNVWRRRLADDGRTTIVHLNPVYDAEEFTVAPMASGIPTVGVRDAEAIPTLLGLARFATGRSGYRELRSFLASRTTRYVRSRR